MPLLTAGHRDRTLDLLTRETRPLTGSGDDHDPLLALIGDRGFVLLGEA